MIVQQLQKTYITREKPHRRRCSFSTPQSSDIRVCLYATQCLPFSRCVMRTSCLLFLSGPTPFQGQTPTHTSGALIEAVEGFSFF